MCKSVLWYGWLGLLTCKNHLPYNLCSVGGRVGIVGGSPSSCLQTPIFEWKSASNFNPWAKFQTFWQLTPSSFRSIPTLVLYALDKNLNFSCSHFYMQVRYLLSYLCLYVCLSVCLSYAWVELSTEFEYTCVLKIQNVNMPAYSNVVELRLGLSKYCTLTRSSCCSRLARSAATIFRDNLHQM